MEIYFRLSVMGLITAFVSAGLYLAEKKTAFGTWKPKARQILYGVIFGAPAGVISGVIGGAERYLATYWGAGYYGRIAGSVAILFAGLCGAGMRRYMFDDKKPVWYYGLAAGIIAEVVDMLLLLLTRVDDIRQAFYTVELGALPLALMNGLAVMLALFFVSVLGKARKERESEKGREGLVQTFQKWLLVCVTMAFLATSVFTFWVESGISDCQIRNMLRLSITDVSRQILEASDANMLKVAREAALILKATGKDADQEPGGDRYPGGAGADGSQ